MLDELIEDIKKEFPSFKIVLKQESERMKAIDVFLRIITFNTMQKFMTDYTTTVGYTVYVGRGWYSRSEKSRVITLRHERVHMRQRKKYGFVLFSFLYLLCAPTLFAYWRAKFEKEAYEESMRASAELYGAHMLQAIRGNIVDHFLSADYFWMWPFRKSVEKWYDAAAERVIAELAKP